MLAWCDGLFSLVQSILLALEQFLATRPCPNLADVEGLPTSSEQAGLSPGGGQGRGPIPQGLSTLLIPAPSLFSKFKLFFFDCATQHGGS